MAGSSFGTFLKLTTFGESHGGSVGVILDGVTPGLPLTAEDVQIELDRRRPGQSKITTQRNESDIVEICSGVFEGLTTGTPIMMTVRNQDAKSESYDGVKTLFRPGHADWGYMQKYGLRDYRGGGRSSARETIGRVAAGAVAKKLLARRGVTLKAYTVRGAGIDAPKRDWKTIEQNIVRAADPEAAVLIIEAIQRAQADADSVGGVIECTVSGVPPGLGDPVFDKLDADIAKAVMSIGATKGIEFGDGFAAADAKGSVNNDRRNAEGFLSNHAGGILGGISTGQDIVFRIAFKPTPSLAIPQETIDIDGNAIICQTFGRHDPAVFPRAVPVVEAMTALVLEDHFKRQAALRN